MTVQGLARLLRHLHVEFSDEDIRDVLWLAPHVDGSAVLAGEPTPARDSPGPSLPAGRQPGDPASRRSGRPPAPMTHGAGATHSYPAHLRPAGNPVSGSGVHGTSMRAPAAPALAGQLSLTKAMRPLNRKVGSRHGEVLDEEATASRIAEEHLWVPALKPAPTRWLDLALVVDGYESMSIWRRMVAELRDLLERLGAFKDVRFWILDHHENDPGRPGVRRQAGSPLRSPRELIDPAARRVIVVISDCLGPMWQSQAAQGVLADWARRGPVAIVQPLPQRLWAYSHARPVPARLRALQPGLPNGQLSWRGPSGGPLPGRGGSVPVPVLELDAVWLASWSRLLTASGAAPVDAMVVFAGGEPEPAGSDPPAEQKPLTPLQRVQRFRATASPEAVQLAHYLSAAPISLPVIRLVQQAMLKHTSPFPLAEVFLGGLLYRLDAPATIEPDDVQYDFHPGVRDVLLRRLLRSEALRTLRKVSAFVDAHFGQARDFRALLAGADLTGDLLIGPDSRPFAMVAAQVLRLLGGQYAETAARLSAALDGTAPPPAPVIASSSGPMPPDDTKPVGKPVAPTGPGGTYDERFAAALAQVSLHDRRSPRRPLACPYCYHAFAERDILFRCSGRAAVGSTACPPQPDPVLRREMGQSGLLPPVYPADGHRDEAVCPTCGWPSRTQVCPGCHSRLPARFRAVQGRLIALVGTSQAGKTAFMTVLIHELRHQAGEILNSSTIGADDTTQERFTSAYEWPLYKQSQLSFHHARRSGTQYIRPLVFRFTMDQRARFRPHSRELLLSFADSAGEDLVSLEKINLMARYLAAADAVLVLIDPLRFPDVRRRLGRRTPMPSPMRPEEEPVAAFNRITSLLLAGTGQERIDKPVAVVLSKVDALRLDPDSPLRRPSPLQPYFDETDNLAVQEQVKKLLKSWGGAGLDETARENYTRCRYFAVSALGVTPTEHNQIPPHGIRPYRAAEPFLWVLNQFGFVRSQ
ncbi:MAG TPA: SAV_2336 N-terminal domain-related protein [Streptosporangiaceae bacterium]|nr:SAV_2336 N-terminal domain-related protein [Streptosporangiaceae bacterium]